ncbi:MAG: Fur family transcriptional regulator [Candidatus Muiribacteriota bacterium]
MRSRKGKCFCCNRNIENCLWKTKFVNTGLKFTVPRQEIINIMQKAENSLSAEDVITIIKKKSPETGAATVYRTLDLLTKMGFLQKVDSGDKISRYQLKGKEHHHFLECVKCGKLIEYTSDITHDEKEIFRKEENKISRKYDFKINYHIVKFYGFCKECK